jgi:hypothetical protein
MALHRVLGVGLLAVSVLSLGCDDDDDPITPDLPTQLTASLDDGNERPPVVTTTNATGNASFTVNSNGTISYSVRVANTTSRVTLCHIHAGAADAAGPVIVNLCDAAGTTAAVTTETEIASGIISKGVNASVKGSSPIDIDALLELILAGDAYVNVHTANNGSGEVRGQITAVTP